MGELRQAIFYDWQGLATPATESKPARDAVRTRWESELIQFTLRPFLKKLVQRKQKKRQGIRILEIGSSYGQNYGIISRIRQDASELSLEPSYLLPEEMIELYLGLEQDLDLVESANELHKDQKRVRFIKADYHEGLGMFKELEAPFDVYFSAWGALSRLTPQELYDLLKDICEHAHPHSLIVLDVKGKYSILNSFMADAPEGYDWSGEEIAHLVGELSRDLDANLEILRQVDRSILVACPEDQRAYGNFFKHIRQSVNSLLEPFVRTDLSKLILKPEIFPDTSHAQVESFLSQLLNSWNLMIKYAQKRLQAPIAPHDLKDWASFPPILQFGLLTLDRLIRDNEWIAYGDPRANLIEPHIAYILRSLEFELQQGLGCGQHLSVLLRVKK